MQPNQLNNQPTPTPMPNPAPTSKTTKLPWTCATIAIILALAGIGFGVYTFMDSNSKSDEIANLKTKISTLQSSSNEKETDDPGNGTAKEIDFGFTEKNFVGEVESTISPSPESSLTVVASQSVHSWSGGATYSLNAKGKITVVATSVESCNYYGKCEDGRLEKDITALFSKKVVNISIGQWGNGGDSWLIAVLEDGTAETLSEHEALNDEKANAIKDAKNIVFAYGNLSTMTSLGYLQDSNGKIHSISHSSSEGQTTIFAIEE